MDVGSREVVARRTVADLMGDMRILTRRVREVVVTIDPLRLLVWRLV